MQNLQQQVEAEAANIYKIYYDCAKNVLTSDANIHEVAQRTSIQAIEFEMKNTGFGTRLAFYECLVQEILKIKPVKK